MVHRIHRVFIRTLLFEAPNFSDFRKFSVIHTRLSADVAIAQIPTDTANRHGIVAMTQRTFENVVSLRNAVLMAILAIHGIEVDALIESELHSSLHNRLHTFDIRRIVDSAITYMPATA